MAKTKKIINENALAVYLSWTEKIQGERKERPIYNLKFVKKEPLSGEPVKVDVIKISGYHMERLVLMLKHEFLEENYKDKK